MDNENKEIKDMQDAGTGAPLKTPLPDSAAPALPPAPGASVAQRPGRPASRRCGALKADGGHCRLWALPGSEPARCWFHHDPEAVKAAARKGHAVSQGQACADVPRLKNIRTLDDLTRALSGLARDVLKGRVSPSQANAACGALTSLGRIQLEARTLEQLERLNLQLESRGAGGEALLKALDVVGGGNE